MALTRSPIDRFRLEVRPDAVARPDPGLFACDAHGPLLEWNSYWGGQNLHFVFALALSGAKGVEFPCPASATGCGGGYSLLPHLGDTRVHVIVRDGIPMR